MKKKNEQYRVWRSRDNKEQKLEDMTILYIKNCIAMIVRSYNPKNAGGKDVFDYDWTCEHGIKYIKAFCKELKNRNIVDSANYK